MRCVRMHRIYHKKVMLRDCSRLSWERERLDHALRGAAGHGRPCPYGSPARSGGWRGTADRARTGRPRAPGRGGARQTVPGGVACALRGVAGHGRPCAEGSPARSGAWWGTADRARTGRPRAPGGGGARQTVSGGVARAPQGVVGHGMPCPEGSPARSGGWWGTADRARTGRPRAPGGGGARQTVSGGVARAPRGVVGHGMPCPEGSPARSGGCAVPTLNAPQPVLYYFAPDDIASRVSVDRLLNVLTVGLVKVEFVRADGD